MKNHLAAALQAGLEHWTSLPGHSVSKRHLQLVHLFARVVDAQDATLLVREVTSKRRASTMSEVKNKLATWRERVPQPWHALPVWADVLLWRMNVYAALNRFLAADPDASVSALGSHEMAWSLNAYAHVARKQHLVQSALEMLERVYQLPTLQVDDAFRKLREQVKNYFQLPNAYLPDALAIISATNAEHFTEHQQSEWSMLRGQLLERQAVAAGAGAAAQFEEQANMAYAEATRHGLSSFAKGWINWGLYCDRRMQTPSNEDDRKQWGGYMVPCFIQGMRHDPGRTRRYIPRLLWLMAYEEESHQGNWTSHFKDLPGWVFLDHLPQLIMSLLKHDTSAVLEQTLAHVAVTHPQAVYYALRAHAGLFSAGQQPDAVAALERVKSSLLQAHKELNLIEEVCVALEKTFGGSDADDWLLCESLRAAVRECRVHSGALPQSLRDRLTDLGQRFGPALAEFAKLASAKATKGSSLLGKLYDALALVQERLHARAVRQLQDASQLLVSAAEVRLELPGLHLVSRSEHDLWNPPSVLRFLPRVDCVARDAGGVDIYVYVSTSVGVAQRLQVIRAERAVDAAREERCLYLRKHLNDFLLRDVRARQLGLRFSVPLASWVGPCLTLRGAPSHAAAHASLEDAQAWHWRRLGVAPAAAVDMAPPATMVSDYLAVHVDNGVALAAAKMQLARQFGLESALSWLLRVPDASLGPHVFELALPGGDLTVHACPLDYCMQGAVVALEGGDGVHMRLTPNVSAALGAQLMHGVVAPALEATASVVARKHSKLWAHLAMHLRDDIFLWALEGRRPAVYDSVPAVKPAVDQLVRATLARAQTLISDDGGGVGGGAEGRVAVDHAVQQLLSVNNASSLPMPWL